MAKNTFKVNGFRVRGDKFIVNSSIYTRGGILHDKWGNTHKEPLSLRDARSGIVFDRKGNVEGIEKNLKHHYARDPTIFKATMLQSKRKKAIMISLRKRGRIN